MPARGEVWWCELPDIGRRPIVVLSRDSAVAARGRALVAPCTARHRGLLTEVELRRGDDPVPRDCVANLDSVEQVSVAVLTVRLGRLSDARLRELCRALAVAVDCAG